MALVGASEDSSHSSSSSRSVLPYSIFIYETLHRKPTATGHKGEPNHQSEEIGTSTENENLNYSSFLPMPALVGG